MRKKQWMVLLVVGILAVFTGNGQAAVIYANSVDSFSTGVTNSGNLTGVQDLKYARFSSESSAILGFSQNFVDVSGGDAMIYIEAFDLFKISGLTLEAQKLDNSWVPLTPIEGVDLQIIGWWFDWTKGYEIPNSNSNQYDHIKISYSGSGSIDVDALRVNTGSAAAPVPEPGTMMLLGSGLVALAGWGRKKFRN